MNHARRWEFLEDFRETFLVKYLPNEESFLQRLS